MTKRIDLHRLKEIPILHVAQALHMDVVRNGSVWAMKEGNEVSSLTLSPSRNNWKRWSGKERGGVSRGSTIDLVMHIRECSFRDALDFLSTLV